MYVPGILVGISLDLYIVFVILAMFTRLILLIHEHERSFHLPVSSSFSSFVIM